MTLFKSFQLILNHPHNRDQFFPTLLRIFWWKSNQLFFHLPTIAEIAPGVKIICYPNNSYGSFIVYATWPEYDELQFIYKILGKSDIYLDVGAHIGDSSLLAASKISKGKVLAFEPTPAIYAELLANIRLNKFEHRITPIKKAVSNSNSYAYFTLESESEINHLDMSKKHADSIKIETVTLDRIINRFKLKKVSLLKIDVEGFELEVLEGCTKNLADQKIEMILFEVNPKTPAITDKVLEIQKLLKSNNFSFYEFNTGKLSQIEDLYVPTATGNFLAVLSRRSITKKLALWIS